MPRDAFGNIIPGSYGPGSIGPGTGNAALRSAMPGGAGPAMGGVQSYNQQAMLRGPMSNASPAAAALLRASPMAAFNRAPALQKAPVARPIGTPVRAPEPGAPTNFSPQAAAILRQQQINAYRPR